MTPPQPGRRRSLTTLTGSIVALLGCAAVAAAAPPSNDPARQGPPDGPRGKNQRTPATNITTRLPDFWDESPRIGVPNRGAAIPDSYIVIFKPGTPGAADKSREITQANGGQLKYTYEHAVLGFAGNFSENRIDAVRKNPNVLYVEQDRVVGPEDTQTGATWGLDRIDQRDLPLNGSYTDGTEGAGVHAYIVDTGIRRDARGVQRPGGQRL